MAMYVIDSNRGLWRVDREGAEDWNSIAVERPASPHGGHRQTARLPFDEIIVDPADHELAELDTAELARFGMTRQQLLGS